MTARLTRQQSELLALTKKAGFVQRASQHGSWTARRAWHVDGKSFSESTGMALVDKKLLHIDPDRDTRMIKNPRGFTIAYRYLVTERKES